MKSSPEGEKIDNSVRQKLLYDEGLSINAVKDDRNVIVTTNGQRLTRLRDRINEYKQSGKFSKFQYLEMFEPYIGSEKQTTDLRKIIYDPLTSSKKIDIQMLLLPKLTKSVYDRILPRLIKHLQDRNGEIIQEPYYLSDGTPVVRALVPSGAVRSISEDDSIYRVEETHFYDPFSTNKIGNTTKGYNLDESIDIESLPVVVVLDTGIQFDNTLEKLVVTHWIPDGSNGGNQEHGTKVASKVIFADLASQLRQKLLRPRARVVDCNILDGQVPDNIMIQRIQQAVAGFKDISKIFNLSANVKKPIEGDEISILGYELDNLMRIHGVQFVISVGNHYLWRNSTSLTEIIDDDDIRVAAPADSMLGITVGAIVGHEHKHSLSKVNEIAPYSRIGPGFAGFPKPDLVAYGGTIVVDSKGEHVPTDDHSILIGRNGSVVKDAGTSFTAPVVAGDLAEITQISPNNDLLIAKALLYHGAVPLWDEEQLDDDEIDIITKLYGRGLSVPDISKYSAPYRVTFIRSGELNKKTKERVKFYMPSILAAVPGRNTAKVTVTCISRPPMDRTKGTQYLNAFISASLHKISTSGKLPSANPSQSEGRRKWDSCFHFEKLFSKFEAGDWEIWLELSTRFEIDNDQLIPYALVVSIEDLSETLDIYNEIQIEAAGRFMPIVSTRISVAN